MGVGPQLSSWAPGLLGSWAPGLLGSWAPGLLAPGPAGYFQPCQLFEKKIKPNSGDCVIVLVGATSVEEEGGQGPVGEAVHVSLELREGPARWCFQEEFGEMVIVASGSLPVMVMFGIARGQGPEDTMSPPNLIAWSDQPPSPYTPLLEDSLSGQPASTTA